MSNSNPDALLDERWEKVPTPKWLGPPYGFALRITWNAGTNSQYHREWEMPSELIDRIIADHNARPTRDCQHVDKVALYRDKSDPAFSWWCRSCGALQWMQMPLFVPSPARDQDALLEDETFAHMIELEQAWLRGALSENDGLGGTRSTRNAELVRRWERKRILAAAQRKESGA